MSNSFQDFLYNLQSENAELKKKLMECRHSIVNLDCRYTLGDVCDISGRHCETKKCARCEYEDEIEKLKKEISDIKEENVWLREDLKDCQRILDKYVWNMGVMRSINTNKEKN
jgi:chromosome segregation ATPase